MLRASLSSGFERRVDVGTVNGTTFLNNASFGLYAAAVGTEDYRRHKVSAFAKAAREALSADKGGEARLSLSVPGSAMIDAGAGTSSVIIVNNAYAPTFAAGKRLRPQLDAGEVWVYFGGGLVQGRSAVAAVAHAAREAVQDDALRGAYGGNRVVITSDRPDVPVAVDGELRPDLVAPFEFASRHGALRLVVPADPTPRTVEVALSW